MAQARFFQSSSNSTTNLFHKYKVSLYVDEKDSARVTKIRNLYDKNMTKSIALIEYDKALSSGDENQIKKCESSIQQMIDEVLVDYKKSILEGSAYKNDASYFDKQLDIILNDVEQYRHSSALNSLLELLLLKLSLLRDKANGIKVSSLEFLLSAPLNDNNAARSNSSVISFARPDIHMFLPLFSRSGSNGINTILFAIFNGYFPIGFGTTPFPVHSDTYKNSAFSTAAHDYFHMFVQVLNLIENAPLLFLKYKNIYEQIFNYKDSELMTKDLLVIFFLLHELGLMLSQEELSKEDPVIASQLLSKCREKIKPLSDIDIGDLAFPLNTLGYNVSENSNVNLVVMKEVLINLLSDFLSRHMMLPKENLNETNYSMAM